MVHSFIEAFKSIPSIPVGIVVDPLIKCIQQSEGTSYHLNLFDFDFFLAVAMHPKLTLIPSGLMLMDELAKIYLSYPCWSNTAL